MLRVISTPCVVLAAFCQLTSAQIEPSLCAAALGTPDSAQQQRGIGAEAICVLEPTLNSESLASPIDGYFLFVKVPGATNDGSDDTICVEYDIENIAEGMHDFHVYTYGALISTDGSAAGGHFRGDCDACRPNAAGDLGSEVGSLNDGAPLVVGNTSTVEGTFNDDIIQFNGNNSIIGRSIIVHATDGSRLAQCVIGHNTPTSDASFNAADINNVGGVTRAIARLTTSNHASSSTEETGWVRFTRRDTSGPLLVELWVTGLVSCDEVHEFHVHQLADVSGDSTTGPHFMGDVDFSVIVGTRPNVGWIGPDNNLNPGLESRALNASETLCSGSWVFLDDHATLEGSNSLVGRSFILHDGNSTDRILHGVIGILEEGAPTEMADDVTPEETPKVLSAMAVVYPTDVMVDFDISEVFGIVEFSAEDGSDDTVVTYHFDGLTRDDGHEWHVYEWGNVGSGNASATGDHFIGSCNDTDPGCRGDGVEAEIGNIGDGELLLPLFGEAYGSFIDSNLPLNGPDSIVGRSIVVHGLATDGSIRVAQGVIGRAMDSPNEMVPNQDTIDALRCDITPLANDDGYDAAGYVRLSRTTLDGDITVDYRITGLSPGEHAWHVHSWGNLLSNQDGVSAGGHFLGDPLPGRSEGVDEVGAINNETPIIADAEGIAEGTFVDNFLHFEGAYSIVGRSIIIHAEPAGGAREAVCVIGIESQADLASGVPSPGPDTSSDESPEDFDSASTATFSMTAILIGAMLALLA